MQKTGLYAILVTQLERQIFAHSDCLSAWVIEEGKVVEEMALQRFYIRQNRRSKHVDRDSIMGAETRHKKGIENDFWWKFSSFNRISDVGCHNENFQFPLKLYKWWRGGYWGSRNPKILWLIARGKKGNRNRFRKDFNFFFIKQVGIPSY